MSQPDPARILIVDDRPEKLLAHGSVLDGLGAEIVLAHSGAEGLKRVLHGEFAVILLDVNMPDIDGFETASLIRRYGRARHTPIIFITGYADEVQTLRGYELGAVDYILSPVAPDVLRTKVRVFLDLFRMRVELAQANQALERRVAERTAELSSANERLQAEIAERLRIESEREALLVRKQELRADAEELSRLKDEFLATMSHELRTPLNAIFGWITLLRTRQLEEATQVRALESIERNARAQKRVIEDLFDAAHVVTGQVALELAATDLRRVTEAALARMLPAARAKDIRVTTSLGEDGATVRGDFARLQQLVCNLLSNAIKFTPSGGSVEVRLARDGDFAEITVRDDGQGIRPEFLPYVFDRFRQQDGSISRRHGGLGLGLAIVRHLAELHGGITAAASDGPGSGATFTVRLPVQATAPSVREPGPAGRSGRSSTLLRGIHALVVDDDPDARELLADMLESLGARASLADSGPTALTRLFETRPHVLIADLGMPGMDGYALIEQIRSLDSDNGGHTPAIAMTAHATVQDRLRALQAGYQNHVTKPVEADELAAVIASLVGRSARERRVANE